jgi:hypothetical protein
MSLRTPMMGCLFLLGSMLALPSCNPVPVLLMTLNGLPANSARAFIIVTQSGRTGKVTFQREDMTNKWLPMESNTRPPQNNCPPSAQFAIELPRGTSGSAAISIQIDPPMMMGMMGQPGTMIAAVAGACVRVDLEDGALNTLDVALQPMAPPPDCT